MKSNITLVALGILCTLPGIGLSAEGPVTAADLLKDVTVADGFEATIFATPDQANYPVFSAAAPDGTLYVSSDRNGSLGRLPNMGRILRLRDTKGTGQADEVKEFVKDVDSPRGLVWDKDRLYLVHPPHLSVYIDKDGDGVADEEKVLVKNLAFTFKDRPADHTTNGLSIGVDGWLYIACGDFGFMEAEGTDGRKLQLRGGGVIRVRPDGTGLELFSYGTRNILEAAISPLLDGFTRDNTNDGDGWDIRFHHFTGLEDHGYPKLFKFFADEHIKPLADYGGGSGCGAVWIDEPGFPSAWNNLPYTCDWGPGPLFRHTVRPKGATFEELEKPVSLVKVPKSTDADVDGMSHVYVNSWRNGGFSFSTPDIGFITRVTPKGFTPEPLPDFAKAGEEELLRLLETNSHRRRLEAQRELLRRGLKPSGIAALEALSANLQKPLATRVAAVFALKQGRGESSHPFLIRLCEDQTIAAWAIRALGDRWDQVANVPTEPVVRLGIKSSDARTRREAVGTLARIGNMDLAPAIAPLMEDADEVVAHTAVQALIRLKATKAALAIIDRPDATETLRNGALRVVQAIHEPAVVDALVARLEHEENKGRRLGLCRALSRLYSVEGEWKGDSWATRPDTRGPYYQPEKWAQSDRIGEALLAALNRADAEEAATLSSEFGRHRIKPGDAIGKLLKLAEVNAAVLPTLARQLSQEDSVPAQAIPLLVKILRDNDQPTFTRAMAGIALAKSDGTDGLMDLYEILPTIPSGGNGSDLDKAKNAFYNAPKLENFHQHFEEVAATEKGEKAKQADVVLIKLAKRTTGAPESRIMSQKALEDGWMASPARRRQIMSAMMTARTTLNSLEIKIVEALNDPDVAVQKTAADAVKALRLNTEKILAASKPAGPLISTLKGEDVIHQVVSAKGDRSRGEQLFTQQGCVNCHTVAQGQPLKGPYLGTIAQTYNRTELAEAILYPNKTIAQGFATNVFTLKDGSVQMGFVVQEAADKIMVRNIAGQEIAIAVNQVASRTTDPKSLMPEGLLGNLAVKDFAALLDYLDALAKGGK
ncbi:MAG: heme-binding domain-containing protein [Proteobacteria bacterium]|nr:heme-binding domain-containing protein [Pseudomonadota bacterium]